jgi:hypothetical protein
MVKEETNNLHTINRRKVNTTYDILHSNCLLKYAAEGKTEGRYNRKSRKKM